MAMLTKKEILSANDRSTIVMEVPEWGGEITLGSMSSQDRDRYEEILTSPKSDKYDNIVAQFVAKSIMDENGDRVFEESDIIALGKKSGKVMLRVFMEARKLNDLTEEDVQEKAKN